MTSSPHSITASQLAGKLQAEMEGPDLTISGVTSPQYPQKNKIIPLIEFGKKDREMMEATLKAGNCFLVAKENQSQLPTVSDHHTWILTPAANIKKVFIALLQHFDIYHTPSPMVEVNSVSGRISESSKKALAAIGSNIADDVFIGPQVVVGKDTRIASGAVLLGQNYIGYGVRLGRNTSIHPQVTLHNGTVIGDHCIIHSGTVLGSDGFGYEPTPQGMVKIPQIGNVVIGHWVEIGSNCSVDRATLNSTQIGDRVKLDNLIQIGHNVTIGNDCVIVSQTGIGGSTRIGKQVVLAGQVGIVDHVVIGDGVKVAAKSAIFSKRHIPPGSQLRGIPAIDHIKQARIDANLRKMVK